MVTTDEMLAACRREFPACDGLIGAAAPCDYRPTEVANHKLKKTGEALLVKLVETEDIVASLGREKQSAQWTVGFALETEDARFRAITKLQKKSCDLVVLNGAAAIDSSSNNVEILAPDGTVVGAYNGEKEYVSTKILGVINRLLIRATVS